MTDKEWVRSNSPDDLTINEAIAFHDELQESYDKDHNLLDCCRNPQCTTTELIANAKGRMDNMLYTTKALLKRVAEAVEK